MHTRCVAIALLVLALLCPGVTYARLGPSLGVGLMPVTLITPITAEVSISLLTWSDELLTWSATQLTWEP